MVFSRINRFLLLALLPVTALIVYIEGQSYNPELIQFTSSEISTGAEATLFPREIKGFSRSGQVRVFSKDNLYEYVNGHAEYFLSAGFKRLAVGEYVQTGTDPGQADIVVDIYDMGKSIQAFGVLTDEIGINPSFIQVGIVGAKTPQGMSFVSDKYYVKISSFRETIPIDVFAESIITKIGSSTEALPAFLRLPDVGDVVVTRFVKEAYRGLGFVNNVIEREYMVQDKTVQVSLVSAPASEVKQLVASYLDFFQESDIVYIKLNKDGQELYKVIDPYEGDWYLIPFSDALFGIYGMEDDAMLDQFLISIVKSGTVKNGS
jgi:hypothetical protein